MLRKHIEFPISFPRDCELCEENFENVRELKKHMIIHSLEGTIFGQLACKECRFLGDNFETMEVHNGKCCVSDFYCGLCEMKADTLENLETHLVSCEVYECEECEKRLTKLSDMKLHLEDDHSKDKNFFHLKMHRILKSKVDCKKYSYSDLYKFYSVFVIIFVGKAP
jgi:hypothetical protein